MQWSARQQQLRSNHSGQAAELLPCEALMNISLHIVSVVCNRRRLTHADSRIERIAALLGGILLFRQSLSAEFGHETFQLTQSQTTVRGISSICQF